MTISPEVPDSRQRVSQVALHLASPLAPWRLEAEASWYDAHARSERDFDGGRAAIPLGVCRSGLTFGGAAGAARPVERIVGVDVLSETDQRLEQWTEELRLQRDPGSRVRWMLGLAATQVRERNVGAFALGGGVLNAGEQLTAFLPATPLRVGPISQFNRLLVADPSRDRSINSSSSSDRDMLAVFGTWDYAPRDTLSIRAELRVSRERERIANLLAPTAPPIPSQSFDDATPRLSLDWHPDANSNGWLSVARGSRSGGVNALTGLDPDEQGYGPEHNWTWEAGWRQAGATGAEHGLRALQLVAYYVDWRNVQITGFANTPGVNAQILRNARGIIASGLEASIRYAPLRTLELDASASLARPRFRAGSEDLSSRGFCGLTLGNTSSFCTVGLTRNPGSAGSILVPWIDGNRPPRTPERMLALGLSFTPDYAPLEGRLRLRVDAAWQDDVFDRAVDGARYGERTLVDARLGWTRAPWSIELWGRNLGNDRYVAAAGARGAGFYPTSPRPIDLLYGEGRRYGLSLAWRQSGARH